ncbi:hypothetical protein GH714_042326 [Hevea brasiliensis]|uniref:Nucleobase-ascorbate transporter 11 n=1 Tax=Hevea brasiliensis TaxID=3981 RepID=A0A6A6KA49_HEVBR|nr:hypothetical protein GH714_042326 [Hevea brasiliensis]
METGSSSDSVGKTEPQEKELVRPLQATVRSLIAGLVDLERGHNYQKNGGSSPKMEIDPVLGQTRPARGSEIEPASGTASRSGNEFRNGNDRNLGLRDENKRRRIGDESVLGVRDEEREVGFNGNAIGDGNVNVNGSSTRNGSAYGIGNEVPAPTPALEPTKEEENAGTDIGIEIYPGGDDPDSGGWLRQSGMRLGLRDNPGFVPLMYYGLQHYLSLAGSLIFIPLIIVPAMGGTDRDTATVISTMLMVSGITTILHSYFGTRLPLVQGSSFVYLAPALVIMNAEEYRNLSEHKFRHIMRELQGAIIVGSIFQSILGFTGLMSLLLRLINPVVVAPTVTAVGPLSVMIIWTYAFFLTAGGAYDYKGCSPDIPSSNILLDACRRHAYTMQHCRTDVSNAWRTSVWVRIPYPLQWGVPIFHLRTSLIMIIVSLIASVDSVGTYHSASLQVNSKPPTPGIVSRGIGLEGFCSILAGLWGSGTGKVGAILASIPLALAASILCFMWGLITALGLSTLQYSQTSSFRNIAIVGVSLFLDHSILISSCEVPRLRSCLLILGPQRLEVMQLNL